MAPLHPPRGKAPYDTKGLIPEASPDTPMRRSHIPELLEGSRLCKVFWCLSEITWGPRLMALFWPPVSRSLQEEAILCIR